jgi:hypothetical protein
MRRCMLFAMADGLARYHHTEDSHFMPLFSMLFREESQVPKSEAPGAPGTWAPVREEKSDAH